jgi:hypothetical protein
MGLRQMFLPPVLLALALVILAIGLSLVLSIYIGKEIIPRSGATLSGIGAALVIYQAILEASIAQGEASDAKSLGNLSPFFREQAVKTVRQRSELRRIVRLQMVVAISLIVFFGEIMHGWGDYMYRLMPQRHIATETIR